MKIWILRSNEPLPGVDNGTRPQRAALLARELSARGHQVTFWASTFDHFQKRNRFASNVTVPLEKTLTVKLLHSRGYRKNVSLARYVDHLQVARSFAAESTFLSAPDLVFAALPTLELSAAGARFAAAACSPFVVDIRDLWPDELIHKVPPRLRGVGKVITWPMSRDRNTIVRSASAILAVSDTYLAWGLRHARRARTDFDRVFVHGYPALQPDWTLLPELEARGIDLKKKLIVYAGTFNGNADLRTILQAATELNRLGDNVYQFILAGSGEQKDRLIRLASGLPNVVFPGWLSHKQITTLLHQAFLGIAPYKLAALISLPNKIFEYMSAGLPVLNSLEGECSHLIDRLGVGLNYTPSSSHDLLEQIRCISNSATTYMEMKARANHHFSTSFSADVLYNQMADHLELIVNARQPTIQTNIAV